MEWAEAKVKTLELWMRIRRMTDEPDELALLTEINAMCDLCNTARDQKPESLEMCSYCLAYQQFGGCRAVNAEMSELVVTKDWETLRARVDGFIESLKSIELPPAGNAAN